MKKILNRRGKKLLKHSSISLALCILVIASVIIANTALSALSGAFGWYIDMRKEMLFGVSKNCENYLENTVFPLMDKQNDANGTDEKISIIFCDEAKNLDDELSKEYVYNTALELEKKFPDRIEIKHLNIWEDPSTARLYGVTKVSDVVFKFHDNVSTLGLSQFYVAKNGNIETPSAYNGERRFSSAMLRIADPDTPMCYFTSNHGETMGDYELMYLLADAGYNYAFINLLTDDIPDDCDLLITANPARDLMEPSESANISEREKLDAYMRGGGKYMVLVSYETFGAGGFKHFEGFLAQWGVKFMHSASDDGVENCYTVRDIQNATQPDGYTFFSDYAENSAADKIFTNKIKKNVFSYATVISPADDFIKSGDAYLHEGTAFYPLLTTHASAEAWSGGYIADKADDAPFTLLSLSERTCENGKTASLVASTSVAFCEEDALQSVSYGNSDTILQILSYFGNENVPLTLTSKPLTAPPIQTLTTRNATIITVILCVVPTLVIACTGIIVLVRRKHS